MHVLIQFKNRFLVHKEKQMLTLDSIKFLMYKIQSIHSIQNQKQITDESNKLCIIQTRRKNTRCVKKIKP